MKRITNYSTGNEQLDGIIVDLKIAALSANPTAVYLINSAIAKLEDYHRKDGGLGWNGNASDPLLQGLNSPPPTPGAIALAKLSNEQIRVMSAKEFDEMGITQADMDNSFRFELPEESNQ